MKHSIKLLSSELNRYCDFYHAKKEDFNEEMISLFCKAYRNKFNFFYSELDQIEKDLKILLGS